MFLKTLIDIYKKQASLSYIKVKGMQILTSTLRSIASVSCHACTVEGSFSVDTARIQVTWNILTAFIDV